MENEKKLVKTFWNDASCGEELFLHGDSERSKFENQMKMRYELEPYILEFADFTNQRGKKVLEIGVGLGSDHQKFAENGADLSGCDLTERAINLTKNRFALFGLNSNLQVADAESLPYEDNSFDTVYSYGVIHHSPNTKQAAKEIYRILKPKGEAKVMIYHKYSFVGYMLWLRYGLMQFNPFISLEKIYSKYLESPGTKAYSIPAAKEMFSMFNSVKVKIELSHGDLLSEFAGQRHKGIILKIARLLYPRKIIKRLFPNHGLFMLIHLVK
jgi:ubiquinone/menaquinone biosynthesis C-methylase UbiE